MLGPPDLLPGPSPLTAGELVGKYRIGRLVGAGGMGFVYEAKHETLGESFALKILRPDALMNSDNTRRFLSEARAVARIKSEHVARVLDVGTHVALGTPYMVMELLEGEDLARVLEGRGRFPIPAAVDYVLQALEAVAHAHALGIVHRDLKPSNLFLARGQDGREIVKVLDFGVSKFDESLALRAKASTATNQVLGTPAYMSPEQLRSSKSVDARSDIWATGVVLFELLTGDVPFASSSVGDLFAAIFEEEPPLLRTQLPDAPEGLEQVLRRCLQRKADNRFPDVGALAAALAPFGTAAASVSIDNISRRSLPRIASRPDMAEAIADPVPSSARFGAIALARTLPLEVDAPTATSTSALTAMPLAVAAAARNRPHRMQIGAAVAMTIVLTAGLVMVLSRTNSPQPREESVASRPSAPDWAPKSTEPPSEPSASATVAVAAALLTTENGTASTATSAAPLPARAPVPSPSVVRSPGNAPARVSAPPTAPALLQHDRN